MAKKVLAVLLATLMILCAIPFTTFAADNGVSAESKVANWNENYSLVLERLSENEKSAHWQYVDQNKKKISDTMVTLTAFSLYDDAWANGMDNHISVEQAEKILASLIEKVDANIGESKLAEITSVLKTARDINDLIQKVNGYVKISDVLTSEEWTKAFKYINYWIDAYNMYDKARDDVIEAYSRILSVQAANEMYIDFLQYIVDTCSYSTVVTAAQNMIDDLNANIADAVADKLVSLAVSTGTGVIEDAIEVAMESNYYAAIVVAVYNAGNKAADYLWNTGDLYECYDALYTTYFVEKAAESWYSDAKSSGNAEWIEFAVNTLLALREAGIDTLYNAKNAENEGFVGKVKNQINYNISFEYVAEKCFLQLAREVLINKSIKDAKPVNTILTVCSSAFVHDGDFSLFNQEGIFSGSNGDSCVLFNDGTSTYVKTLFLNEDSNVEFKYSTDAFLTVTVEKNSPYGIEDWSFTNEQIGADKYVTLDTALTEKTFNVVKGEEIIAKDLNDEFEYPDINDITVSSVTEAVKDIAVSEARGKVLQIKDLIESFFATIKKFFETIFKINKD